MSVAAEPRGHLGRWTESILHCSEGVAMAARADRTGHHHRMSRLGRWTGWHITPFVSEHIHIVFTVAVVALNNTSFDNIWWRVIWVDSHRHFFVAEFFQRSEPLVAIQYNVNIAVLNNVWHLML